MRLGIVSICLAFALADVADIHRPEGVQPDSLLDSIPVESARVRAYKLKLFNQAVYQWFESAAGEAAATPLMVLFYLFASYIPAIALTCLLSLCKKQPPQPLPASGFSFNQ